MLRPGQPVPVQGVRPPSPRPTPFADPAYKIAGVDAIGRRGPSWPVNVTVVQEFGVRNYGAQLIVKPNPRRIRVVLYNPYMNASICYLGNATLSPGPNPPSTISGLDMEAGTGWEIDDTTDGIYAFAQATFGAIPIRWFEVSEDQRIPLWLP